jgi:hypothetical protein
VLVAILEADVGLAAGDEDQTDEEQGVAHAANLPGFIPMPAPCANVGSRPGRRG